MSATGTRQRLLDATCAVIADGGLTAATARAITARAKANLAAIPYHFTSKDALVAEALAQQARALLAPVLEVLASDQPPVERTVAAARALTAIVGDAHDQIRVYLTSVAVAGHDDHVRSVLAALTAQIRQQLTTDIAAQCADGSLPSWVQPEAMAALLIAMANGIALGRQVEPEGPTSDAVAAQAVALLLAARPGRATP